MLRYEASKRSAARGDAIIRRRWVPLSTTGFTKLGPAQNDFAVLELHYRNAQRDGTVDISLDNWTVDTRSRSTTV